MLQNEVLTERARSICDERDEKKSPQRLQRRDKVDTTRLHASPCHARRDDVRHDFGNTCKRRCSSSGYNHFEATSKTATMMIAPSPTIAMIVGA